MTEHLEVKLQPELNDPRVTCGQDLTEAARITRDVRRAEIGAIERIENLRAELEVTPLAQTEVLREIEIEAGESRSAHDPDAGCAECLWRGGECGLERIDIEPAIHSTLRIGQNGIADKVRTSTPFTSDGENRCAGEGRCQSEAALQRVDAGHLPSTKEQVGCLMPIVAETAPMSERQLPDITRDEAMLDVEFGQPAIVPRVVAVLWLAEGPGVEARAAAACRDVVRRPGQCFAPGVTDQPRQAAGEAFLQARLQRVVARADAVLHPLNIAECRVRTRALRLLSVRILNHRALIQVTEAIQLRSFVTNLRDV